MRALGPRFPPGAASEACRCWDLQKLSRKHRCNTAPASPDVRRPDTLEGCVCSRQPGPALSSPHRSGLAFTHWGGQGPRQRDGGGHQPTRGAVTRHEARE